MVRRARHNPVRVPTVFSKNRDRLLTTDIARKFLTAILAHRDVAPLLSQQHFSVDGTLVKAWASMKNFQAKPEPVPPVEDKGLDNPPSPPPTPDAETPAQHDPETAQMPRKLQGSQCKGRLSRPEAVECYPCLGDEARSPSVPLLCAEGVSCPGPRDCLVMEELDSVREG